MKLARLGPLALLALVGCSARAEPLEADLVVASAGPASPVAAGEHCVLRMQPAWRSGVNCQLLVQCGDEDLFGGRRIGGYAVCDYAADAFLSALDTERRTDGDPAIDLDVEAGTLAWRGPSDGEEASLAFAGPTRRGPTW